MPRTNSISDHTLIIVLDESETQYTASKVQNERKQQKQLNPNEVEMLAFKNSVTLYKRNVSAW